MLIAALLLNLVILVPLVTALVAGANGMDAAFGTDTDARRILTSIYAAIALVSAGLIAMHLAQHTWAAPMTVGLFAVQITYKLFTIGFVGLGSAVVTTNLVVVAAQVVALATVFLNR